MFNKEIKQYTEKHGFEAFNPKAVLFDMDGVKLTFAEGAMEEIAMMALERNTGARGLRAIMENLMLSSMYEVPARADVAEVRITPKSVRGEEKPKYVLLRELPEAK